jgi:ABC-type transport system involved in multi-copper enzyme maturation permease subunit
MLQLARVEFLKIRRNPSFLLLAGIFVASVVGVNRVVAGVVTGNDELERIIKYPFPHAWASVAYVTSYLLVIPALVVIMHACAEYTYRTNRQNVIDGWGRGQYITAKLILVVALALAATLLVAATALLEGTIAGGEFSLEGSERVAYFFLHAVMYLGLALLLALVLKRSAVTIGVFVAYWLFTENVAEKYLVKVDVAGQLLPLGSSEHLLELPVHAFVDSFSAMEVHVYVLASCAWIAACTLACYREYRKRDL